MPSNGAYVLSLGGAVASRNTVVVFMTLKFNIDHLQCDNIDCCLMIYLNNSLTQLPPLFLHGQPTDAKPTQEGDSGHRHDLGGSTLTCGTAYLRAEQRDIVMQSLEGARLLTFSRSRTGGKSVEGSGWDRRGGSGEWSKEKSVVRSRPKVKAKGAGRRGKSKAGLLQAQGRFVVTAVSDHNEIRW